jgi:hypothetical protein
VEGKQRHAVSAYSPHELAREFPLIILTLQSLSRGEVGIKDRRVIDAQGKLISGYNLSGKIDEEVKKNLR